MALTLSEDNSPRGSTIHRVEAQCVDTARHSAAFRASSRMHFIQSLAVAIVMPLQVVMPRRFDEDCCETLT
jgi:hypothetical protein